ncbi:hypothetical protein GCM10010401_07370 [Rarobacter faecitabidus]|uniref:DUF6093 family protein n=1 Tax=Rarobacter faecitabidus TaxID=13243 RepID=UPI0031D08FC9
MTIGDELAATLPRLRAMAESLMRDTVKVERIAGKPDPESGEAPRTQVYPVESTPAKWKRGLGGIGKVQTYEAHDTVREVVGATVTTQRYRVDVPVGSFAPAEGDIVTILAAALDPNLRGRTYRVEALLHKTAATAYRLQVSEVLP